MSSICSLLILLFFLADGDAVSFVRSIVSLLAFATTVLDLFAARAHLQIDSLAFFVFTLLLAAVSALLGLLTFELVPHFLTLLVLLQVAAATLVVIEFDYGRGLCAQTINQHSVHGERLDVDFEATQYLA